MPKEKTENQRLLATLADYQRTFSTPHGKRVLRRMMKESGMLSPNFVEGDPYGTAFNEGKRAAVIEILQRTKVDLRDLEKRLKERDEDLE